MEHNYQLFLFYRLYNSNETVRLCDLGIVHGGETKDSRGHINHSIFVCSFKAYRALKVFPSTNHVLNK